MNLSNSETTRNLKCCANGMWVCSDTECRAKTAANALDLIDRQQAEIERLRKTILDGDFSSYIALQAKEAWYRQNSEYINRLEAEIERLQIKVNRLKRYDEERDIRLHARLIAMAKSEAYKECIEKVRGLAKGVHPCSDELRIFDSDLYNLLKEMGCKTDA